MTINTATLPPIPTPPAELHRKANVNNTKKAAAMDNFKAAVMKLITTSDPNTPLTPNQMTILDDRLTHIVSQLRTPNHPPYAAMIQRALQELNQKGGSSEESISQFIKKEYDDLPWAHFTLLKHHLGLLCQSGEVVMTRGSRYSLAVVCSGPGSVKCQRKRRKRRQRRDWWRRQSKRHKTWKENLQIEDEIGVIRELRQVDDQQNQLPLNENKRENGQVEAIQQLKQEGVASVELLRLCDGIGSGVTSEERTLMVEPPLLTVEDAYHTEAGIQQREKCEARNADMIDISDPYAEWLQESNPNEDDMLEHCEERPPGFESMRVEKPPNYQECSTQDLHPEKIPDLLVATKTGLLVAPTSSEHHPLPNGDLEALLTSNSIVTHFEQKLKLCGGCDQPKQNESQLEGAIPIDPQAESLELEQEQEQEQEQHIKPNDSLEALDTDEILENQQQKIMDPHGLPNSDQHLHGLLQIDPGERLPLSDLGESREICGRKEQIQLESTSETGSPLSEDHKQKQHREAEMPRNSQKIEIVKESCTLHQVKRRQQQQQKMNKQQQGEQHFGEQVKNRTAVLALPQQQKKYRLLDTEQIKETQPLLVNPLKYQQQQTKQYYRRKRRRCLEKEMRMEDITLHMDQTTYEHLTERSNLKESQMLSKECEESCVTEKESELQLERTKACSETQKDPEQLNQDFEPVLSDTERVSALESVGAQESSRTQRMQRQLRRWSRKLPEPRPTIELLPSSVLSENDTLGEMLLEKPQEPKKMPSELSPITPQREKLRSWQKQNGPQPQTTTVTLCSSVDLQQKLTNNHISMERSPEPEMQDIRPQLQMTPLEHGKPSQRVLRPRPPKPESVNSAELNWLPSSENQCKKQQQAECQGQGRPMKSKPDATQKKLAFSNIQCEERQQTVNRVRGRPPKSKPDATIDKLLSSNSLSEGLQHIGYRRRGRACKANSTTETLRESTSSIHQNDQDKIRRLKVKPGTVLVKESAPPEHENKYVQKRAEKLGHCIPSEENSEATIMKALPLSDDMHNSKQQKKLKQLKNRRRGRPSKPKLIIDAGKSNALSSENRLRKSSRGRPRKTEE